MKKILTCRRTFIALLALAALTGIAIYNHMDTSMAIASVVGFLAGSNAAENVGKSKYGAEV